LVSSVVKKIKNMKALLYIVSFMFFALLISCEDDYYDFTDKEKLLIMYYEGNSISFHSNNFDTVTYSVVSKNVSYQKVNDVLRSQDVYVQEMNVKFETTNGSGEIEYMKIPLGSFEFGISFQRNDTVLFAGTFHDGNRLDSVISQGIVFSDVLLLIETDNLINDTLLYSTQKGIIKFACSETGEVFNLIENDQY
jgi:hypothetical protein